MDATPEGSASRSRLIAKELQVAVSSSRRTLYFHGESMRPLLVEGDEVVVEPVAWERIRRGDIITYRYLDRFPTRRVVGKSEDRLDLYCDNWPGRSFTTTRNDVLGRAIARKRDGAWLTVNDREWKRARRTAMIRFLREAPVPLVYWPIRRLVGLTRQLFRRFRPSAG